MPLVLYLEEARAAESVSLSVPTMRRLIRQGKFPAPRMLSGRRVAWLVRELEQWAEQRPVSTLLPPEGCTKPAEESA